MRPNKKKFSKGQQVFINVYLSKNANEYFMALAKIEEVPSGKKRLFKVKIEAVADRSIGGPPSDQQAALLGRIVSKKYEELHKELPPFMTPGGWIEIVKG